MKSTILAFVIMASGLEAQEMPPLTQSEDAAAPGAGSAVGKGDSESSEETSGKNDSSKIEEKSNVLSGDAKFIRIDLLYLEDDNVDIQRLRADKEYQSSKLARKTREVIRISKALNMELPEDFSIAGIEAFIKEARTRLGPAELRQELKGGIADPAVEAMVKNRDFDSLAKVLGGREDRYLQERTIFAIGEQCSGYSEFMIPILKNWNVERGVSNTEMFLQTIEMKDALVKAIAKDLKIDGLENLTIPSVAAFITKARTVLNERKSSAEPAD